MTAPAPLTVEDVLRSPALQLVLLAGADGLSRRVSWAHVSELPDPTPWLLGAELLMTTGLAVPKTARAQVAYLHRLDDAGVSALAVSAQLHAPPLSAALRRAADERGFPLLEVPLSVPFVAIAQEVAASTGGDAERLGAQLQVFGALRWLTEENLHTAEVFARLEKLSGYDLALCTAQGRALLPGVPVPDGDLPPLPADGQQAAPTVAGGFVLPVSAPGGTAGYLVARPRRGARVGGLTVVQHIATVAALQLTMLRHQRETARREGAETLAEMLDGVLDAGTVRRRLVRAGFDADASLLLASSVATDGTTDPTPDDAPLVRALEHAELPHLVLRRAREVVLLVPAGPATNDALGAQPALATGTSSPLRMGDSLVLAQREARWARARAADTGRGLVGYDADDAAGRWLPQDVEALRALVDRVLGPAIAYDARHRSELVVTAATWLRRDRHVEDTAEALHIHANTLAYRLRRFATITGFDVTSTSGLTEVWLAVHAMDHLDGPRH